VQTTNSSVFIQTKATDTKKESFVLRLGFLVIFFTLIIQPMILGGVGLFATLALVLAAIILGLLQIYRCFILKINTPVTLKNHLMPWALLPLFVAALWQTALLLPWPQHLAHILSPHFSQQRDMIWSHLAQKPNWSPLSLSAIDSGLFTIRLWATLIFTLQIHYYVEQKHHNKKIHTAIIMSGVLQGIFAVVVFLSRNQGVSFWNHVRGGILLQSFFANPNHQAAFFNITWSTCLLFGLKQAHRKKRYLFLSVSFFLLTCSLLSVSRGGMIASLIGLCLWGVYIIKIKTNNTHRSWFIAGFMFLLGLGVFVSSHIIANEFDDPHLFAKFKIAKESLPLIKRYPVGAGASTFGLAFNNIRSAAHRHYFYKFVENEWVQVLIDYGPYLGTIAILFVFLLLFKLLKQIKHIQRNSNESLFYKKQTHDWMNVLVVIAMLCIHNIVDFNFEVSSISLYTWCLIATLGKYQVPFFYSFSWSKYTLKTYKINTLATLLLSICTPIVVHLFYQRIYMETTSHGVQQQQWLKKMLLLQPTDSWLLVFIASSEEANHHNKEALYWLHHAIQMDPQWSEIRRFSARIFCNLKQERNVAAEIKKLLEEDDQEHKAFVLSTIDRCIQDERLIGALTQALHAKKDAIEILITAADNKKNIVWNNQIFDTYLELPKSEQQVEILSHMAISYLIKKQDKTRAQQALKQLETQFKDSPQAQLASANYYIYEGSRPHAIDILESALKQFPDHIPIRALLVQTLSENKQTARAEELSEELKKSCLIKEYDHLCMFYHRFKAHLLMSHHKLREASYEYQIIVNQKSYSIHDVDQLMSLMDQIDESIQGIEIAKRLSLKNKNKDLQALIKKYEDTLEKKKRQTIKDFLNFGHSSTDN